MVSCCFSFYFFSTCNSTTLFVHNFATFKSCHVFTLLSSTENYFLAVVKVTKAATEEDTELSARFVTMGWSTQKERSTLYIPILTHRNF